MFGLAPGELENNHNLSKNQPSRKKHAVKTDRQRLGTMYAKRMAHVLAPRAAYSEEFFKWPANRPWSLAISPK